mgnify:CR=1 FL=1
MRLFLIIGIVLLNLTSCRKVVKSNSDINKEDTLIIQDKDSSKNLILEIKSEQKKGCNSHYHRWTDCINRKDNSRLLF